MCNTAGGRCLKKAGLLTPAAPPKQGSPRLPGRTNNSLNHQPQLQAYNNPQTPELVGSKANAVSDARAWRVCIQPAAHCAPGTSCSPCPVRWPPLAAALRSGQMSAAVPTRNNSSMSEAPCTTDRGTQHRSTENGALATTCARHTHYHQLQGCKHAALTCRSIAASTSVSHRTQCGAAASWQLSPSW